VVTVQVDGIVHPVTTEMIQSAIEQAAREHADALLIQLSTPGGLMDATREIIEKIFRSPVPVIMWVGPSGARAASAGFFLLECGDIAAMAPGTNTGASHPVLMDGSQMDAVMKQKIENDAAAMMRSVASRRGRNVTAAERTVRESVSYTDREALDLHLIDMIATDPVELTRQLEGREVTRFDGRKQILHFADAQLEAYQPTLRERVMLAIADPNIALLLLFIGALGIYAEFSSPGLIAPGVFGAMLVLLGLAALSLFPIDWLGAALIILALILFVLEAKFGTHGILTAGGALSMLFGTLMLVDTNVPDLRVRFGTAIALTVPFALISTFLFSIAIRARRNKVVMGADAMLGQWCVAVGELNPTGTVMVRGEYWNATAESRVESGGRVRVVAVNGLMLRVDRE
jgi:membrane-bound serine protease (ClpP class)